MSTWFGGICCVANDVLTNDRTMTIRVKLVINMRMLGASDNTVNNNNNLTDVETASGSVPENIFMKSFMALVLVLINNVLSIVLHLFKFLCKK